MGEEIKGYEEEKSDYLEREMMIRYLLGELPAAWQAHFEEILFTDAQCNEQLVLAEDDLIEDYLSGALSHERRSRFETHFLVSERRRRKLEYAELLMSSFANYPPQSTATDADRRINPDKWRIRVALLKPELMAAALAVFVFAAWLQFWYFKQSGHPANTTVKTPPQPSQISPESNLEATDKQQRQLTTQRATPSLSAQSAKAYSSKRFIHTQTLFPGRERDAEDRLSERERRALFTLPPSKRILRLRLVLAHQEGFHSYNVSLATPEGLSVRLPGTVRTHLSSDQNMVTVDIPAGVFKIGDYVLTLLGVTMNGASEEIDQYYFRILN
jgi:hypothetical protein